MIFNVRQLVRSIPKNQVQLDEMNVVWWWLGAEILVVAEARCVVAFSALPPRKL